MKLRILVGLSLSGASEALGIFTRTAKRCFAFARAWLFERIQGQE